MLKIWFFVVLVAAAAILACSDPTPVPTNTPEPTPTPVPTNTPEPTPTPVPTNTPALIATPEPTERASPPADRSVSGGIAPLTMDDPAALAEELSDSELACLAGNAETDRLLKLFASPELASPEEQTQLIECLEEETVLRIFLTGIIGETGTLSEETSDVHTRRGRGDRPPLGDAGGHSGRRTDRHGWQYVGILCDGRLPER